MFREYIVSPSFTIMEIRGPPGNLFLFRSKVVTGKAFIFLATEKKITAVKVCFGKSTEFHWRIHRNCFISRKTNNTKDYCYAIRSDFEGKEHEGSTLAAEVSVSEDDAQVMAGYGNRSKFLSWS